MYLRTLAAATAVALTVGAGSASAGPNIDVDLYFRSGTPSYGGTFFVDFSDGPEFVRIPSSHVRYVRGGDCDVYYCDGRYFAYDDGYWYSARQWDGPWGAVSCSRVPYDVQYVPERYRPRWVVVRDNDPWRRHEVIRRHARHEVRDRYCDRHDGKHSRGRGHGRGHDRD